MRGAAWKVSIRLHEWRSEEGKAWNASPTLRGHPRRIATNCDVRVRMVVGAIQSGAPGVMYSCKVVTQPEVLFSGLHSVFSRIAVGHTLWVK